MVNAKHSRDSLLEYEQREMEFISSRSSFVVKRGYIESARDLYPDLEWSGNIGYGRGFVPLPFLFLLYDKLVLYVPPASQEVLENRWRTPLETVIHLCERQLIQPLIGHPTDYAADHFSPLLDLRPPSVWARGLGLLRALGMEDKLDEKACPLPISRMARLPQLRVRYEKRFPDANARDLTRRLKLELLTNYADLWVFGDGQIADSLSQYQDPNEVVDKLLLANEIRTYPVLFGLGGTANYDLRSLREDPGFFQASHGRKRSWKPSVVPKDLEILLKGIGVNMATMTPDDIIDFHASGFGESLRNAVHHFEKQARIRVKESGQDSDGLFAAAEELQKLLREAATTLSSPRYRRDIARTEGGLQLLFRAGGLAVGGLLGRIAGVGLLETLAVAAVIDQIVPAALRDRLVEEGISERFSPGIANLWTIIKGRASK